MVDIVIKAMQSVKMTKHALNMRLMISGPSKFRHYIFLVKWQT